MSLSLTAERKVSADYLRCQIIIVSRAAAHRVREATPDKVSAPDLPDSKLTNFEDPNSSNRALRAASSACLNSSFSRKEPKM